MQFKLLVSFVSLLILLIPATPLFSQQATVGTPFNSVGDSFYESYGVSWGLNWRGGFARFGTPGGALPPFGNFDPSGGLQTGWRFGNGNFHGHLNFSAAQGFSRSFHSQTPCITLMNGYPGAFYDLSLSPFVTGYMPVVGGYPLYGQVMPGVVPQNNTGEPNPLDRVQVMRRLLASQDKNPPAGPEEPDPGRAMLPRRPVADAVAEKPVVLSKLSSADRPAPSVAEARRLHELENAARDQEISGLFAQAQAAEEAGKPHKAKIYYQMIVRRAQGEQKQTAQKRLQALALE